MVNDKWEMFKNYMHNELAISRDDIKNWIKETVEDTARKLVAQEYEKFSIQECIENMIIENDAYFSKKQLKDDIKREIANIIVKKFTIDLKE
jgi:hypothetical protein